MTDQTKQRTKVVHLSDLHCDGSQKWKDRFNYVKHCLKKEKPDVVIITGDCCDEPKDTYFVSLTKELEGLLGDIASESRDVAIITIPGNHDYSLLGNNVFGVGSSKKVFEKHQPNLNRVHPTKSVDVFQYVFEKHGIAVFPFDSNCSNRYVGFAQGYVPDPELQLEKMSEFYRNLTKPHWIHSYDQILKIGLLHHHPLPLPIKHSVKKELERFLIFENAHQFLHAAENYKLNLILHGHKHIGGTAEYKTGMSQNRLRISACGTSASTGNDDKELVVYDISQSGSIFEKRYLANSTDPNFRVVKDKIPLIPYGYIRKQRNDDLGLYERHGLRRGGSPNVHRIASKTKIVEIKDGPSPITSGDSLVSIYHQGIEWEEDISSGSCYLLEELRADTGRIPWVSYIFSEEPIAPNRLRETLVDIKTRKPRHATSSEVEEFVFEAPVKNHGVSASATRNCEIQYPVFSAFCLSHEEHIATYPQWPERRREEACSIQANYRTDLLELIVRFPSDESFPHEATVAAYLKGERDSKTSVRILKGQYAHAPEELKHLYAKEVLRFRPSLREISLVIQYPQPDVAYSLRWPVPTKIAPVENHRKQQIAESLRKKICARDLEVPLFYAKVETYIKKAFKEDGLDVTLFSLNNDKDVEISYVEVVEGRREYKNARYFATRGITGKAIKTKKMQFFCNPYFRDGQPNVVVEKLTHDFNPHYVLCLPLLYPKPNPGVAPTNAQKVVGVMSVVSHAGNSTLGIFDEFIQDGTKDIDVLMGEVYKTVMDSFYEAFNCGG